MAAVKHAIVIATMTAGYNGLCPALPHLPTLRLFLILILIISLPVSAGPVYDGKVVGISDGDTITVLISGRQQIKVRLAEIDAPEKSQA